MAIPVRPVEGLCLDAHLGARAALRMMKRCGPQGRAGLGLEVMRKRAAPPVGGYCCCGESSVATKGYHEMSGEDPHALHFTLKREHSWGGGGSTRTCP